MCFVLKEKRKTLKSVTVSAFFLEELFLLLLFRSGLHRTDQFDSFSNRFIIFS